MKTLFFNCLLLACLAASSQTGNVGIGVTAPQSKLHVRILASGGTFHPNATAVFESNTVNFLQLSNPATSVSGIFSGTNITNQRSAIKFEADSSIMFTSGGTLNRIVLDNRGYLGINEFTPSARLHVSNGASGNVNTSSSRIATFEDNSSSYIQLLNPTSSESGIVAGNAATLIKSSVVFTSDSAIRFTAGGTLNNMYLDNTGYLGINISNPSTRLHVSNGASGNGNTSSSRIATFEDNASSYIQLLNPTANESGLLAGNAVTSIKSGIVFTADSAISLRAGGNNLRMFIADNGFVGINTGSPQAMLHVKDGAMLSTATSTLPTTPGNPPASGIGSRLMWWPQKAAFRAGTVSTTTWPESSLGKYSFSAGLNTYAFGDGAAAFGNNSLAIGDASFSTGRDTHASSNYAFAGGYGSQARNDYAFAFGYGNDATGSGAVAIGVNNLASGMRSAAFGYTDTASGTNATAMGVFNNAKGNSSFAAGSGLIAKPYNTIAVGSYNEIFNFSEEIPSPYAPVFVVGVGDDETDRQDGLEVFRDGTVKVEYLDVNSYVISNLTPRYDDDYKLGSSTRRWKEVWSANPFLQSSDLRLKSNIHPLQYGLQTVLAMKPVSYNMKANLQSTELGFLAQDMEKLVPEVVVSPEDDGMKAMKYSSLIPVLVQAIKDQQKTIESLEKRIAQLEKKKSRQLK